MFSKGCVYSIQVSDFSKCDGARKYNRYHSSGVLIVWELYNYDKETELLQKKNKVVRMKLRLKVPSHKLTFKCIGATRAVEY